MQTRKYDSAFPDEKSFGVTKKEYFAGIALQGLLANPVITNECTKGQISIAAVRISEQLIIALNESESGVKDESIS